MSLEKAIAHNKEYRKPYYRNGRFDWSCRPHGTCPYCFHNRMHRHYIQMLNAEDTKTEIMSLSSNKIRIFSPKE